MGRNATVRWVMAVAAAGCVGFFVAAGPLNPPGGAVTGTYKTLAEVEPRTAVNATNTPGTATTLYRITQPGSYYLTGNITGESGKNGIVIASSGVSLDLMGFDVVGVAGSINGVTSSGGGSLSGVSVRNGHVRGWGQDGINLSTGGITDLIVFDVASSDNAQFGIAVSSGATISSCAASGNQEAGISTGLSCSVRGCTASSNQIGIVCGSGSSVVGCTAQSNTSTGIVTGATSVVTDCCAYFNQGNGISVSNGSDVSRNAVLGSSLAGIRGTFGVTIRENTCRQNTGASGVAISISGGDNRIEGNTCTTSTKGIEATAAGNFIARNVCSGNTTNWSVAAGNVCLVVVGVTGAAINGNSGGTAPGSTDPNANFTY